MVFSKFAIKKNENPISPYYFRPLEVVKMDFLKCSEIGKVRVKKFLDWDTIRELRW